MARLVLTRLPSIGISLTAIIFAVAVPIDTTSTTDHKEKSENSTDSTTSEHEEVIGIENFYTMLAVGLGVCFLLFICIGIGNLLINTLCKKLLSTTETDAESGIGSGSHRRMSMPKPPPDFEEALKCSKVEYQVDTDNVPPPDYATLKF